MEFFHLLLVKSKSGSKKEKKNVGKGFEWRIIKISDDEPSLTRLINPAGGRRKIVKYESEINTIRRDDENVDLQTVDSVQGQLYCIIATN